MKVRKPSMSYGTVMLVDDNEIDNFINEKVITGANFASNVLIYSSGKSALEHLKNLIRTGQQESVIFPDIIFLDINMPVMDGFQFMDEFEKMKGGMKRVPTVAVLTSSMNPFDKERALKHTIPYYLNKPLSQELLSTLLAD